MSYKPPPTVPLPRKHHLNAILLYSAVALVFSWPLPLNFSTHLTGSFAGDTGVYVWNQWVFRHEILRHHRFPLFTGEVLALTSPVDLSLHNYTLFADILAFPLIPILGTTATFNLVYLTLCVMTAWAMFGLAHSVVRRVPESWLAGLLFGFSPVLMARSAAHASLAAAAPLPLFLFAIRRGHESGDRRFAFLAGAVAGWATMWDAYYGIFCALMAAAYFAATHLTIVPSQEAASPRRKRAIRTADACVVLLLAAMGLIVLAGTRTIALFGFPIALRPFYTPVLLVTVIVALRWWLLRRPRVTHTFPGLRPVLAHLAVAGIGCVIVLLPILVAFGFSLADGAGFHGSIYWRSSPPGVDLLSLVLPNPASPLFGGRSLQWLASRPNGYPENAASLPLVGLAVIAVAIWRFEFRPAREWIWLTVFFGAIALGPFVTIAGLNTHVPTPWTLLRYFPVITATRTPTRYAIPLAMVFSLLFGLALATMGDRLGRYRAPFLVVVGAVLLLELSPLPRRIYEARVPEIFKIIAADPRDIRVLHLPFGFRSGEWVQGNFSASSQFFQTFHKKALVGGYLSRISARKMQRQRESVNVSRLIDLSENRDVAAADLERARQRAADFARRVRLGYVVMETANVSDPLRTYATSAFRLQKIAESDGYELFVPDVGLMSDVTASGETPQTREH